MFPFLADLCESHLIPSQSSLKHWKTSKLAELCYLYFIGLRILLADKTTKEWARHYCTRAGEPNDFTTWRSNGNDLYVMLFALADDDDVAIAPGIIRHWLRHVATHDDEDSTHRLFMRLDSMFKISDGAMRSLRRSVLDWDNVKRRDREDALTKLIQMIHARAPSNSEILPHLKKLSNEMNESASSGATGAASVATVVGGLGAGFDPDGAWRSIYSRKKQKKPIVIRRPQ